MKEKLGRLVNFTGSVEREVYIGNGDFKIYGMDVDYTLYPDIQRNNFGNVTIKGDMVKLDNFVDYDITAYEVISKQYGASYSVVKIRREKPTSQRDVYDFLRAVLTENQADNLYRVYPDIIDRIINNEPVDLEKVKGVKEKSFAKIKKKVIDNFAIMDAVTRFNGLLSFPMIEKLFKKYSSVDLIEKKLNENPYECLCEISRVGFLTADAIVQAMEVESQKRVALGENPSVIFDEPVKTSKQRCQFCVLYLLDKNEDEGNTFITYEDLRDEVSKVANECADHLMDCLQDSRIKFDVKRNAISKATTYKSEAYIAYTIINALKNKNGLSVDNFEDYREMDGKRLTDDQFVVLKMLSKCNVSILNGSAGTGKTSTIHAVIKMLEDHNITYMLMAPTGKAAKVLKEYTGKSTATIHRGLGYNPDKGWAFNEESPLDVDVVIVDETSMIDVDLFMHLLKAIDFTRTRLLMVGDNAQLPSVSCGNVLYDMMQSKLIPTVNLKTVFRYADGGLMKVATDIRNCKEFIPETDSKSVAYGNDYFFINVKETQTVDQETGENIVTDDTLSLTYSIYKKLIDNGIDPANILVLSPQRKGFYGCPIINAQLQMIANKNYKNSSCCKVGSISYYVGDLIIQNVNNYKASTCIGNDEDDEEVAAQQQTFIANGETGVIEDIFDDIVQIRFDNEVVYYTKDDMQNVDLGYCTTVHKSQGSSADFVIFISPKAYTFMLNSNLMYVAVTRTKRRCYHVGMRRTVNYCVKKKVDFNRNTMLQWMLNFFNENLK